MSNIYVIEYLNENEFRKRERAIKKYNMLAFKKLYFEIYPALREGKFNGVLVGSSEDINKYEQTLPTDEIFKKIHGTMTLHYTVYEKEKVVMLDNLTPEDILTEGHQKELSKYKGIPISKSHSETDMFKINLLKMLERD